MVGLKDMLRQYAYNFVSRIDLLDVWAKISVFNSALSIEDQKNNIVDYLDLINGFIDLCRGLDMNVSVIRLEKIAHYLNQAKTELDNGEVQVATCWLFNEENTGLKKLMVDELSSRKFYFVGQGLVSLYEQNQFSERAKVKFASAAFDMIEAGKCLAVGRNTASVFHVMRVVEEGFRTVAAHFNVTIENPNWGGIISKLNSIVKDKSDPDKARLQGIIARIGAIKDAWRNPTIHVGTNYKPDEARQVFEASKHFMEYLAVELA